MGWFERTLAKDLADPAVTAVVAGMHKALPESISAGHSMNESPNGIESGRSVYADLLRAQNDAHNTSTFSRAIRTITWTGFLIPPTGSRTAACCRGGSWGPRERLRYALPPNSADAHGALMNVYGSLVGTVQPNGEIGFEFEKLAEADHSRIG